MNTSTIEAQNTYPSQAAKLRDYERVAAMYTPIYRALLDDIMYSAPREREARAEYISQRVIPRDFADLRKEHIPALGKYAKRVAELKSVAATIIDAPIAKPVKMPNPPTPFSEALSVYRETMQQACGEAFDQLSTVMLQQLADHDWSVESMLPIEPSLPPLRKRGITQRRNQYLKLCRQVDGRLEACPEAIATRRDEMMALEGKRYDAFLWHLWKVSTRDYPTAPRRHGLPVRVVPLKMDDLSNMIIEVEYDSLYVERWMLHRVMVTLPRSQLVAKYYARKVRYVTP